MEYLNLLNSALISGLELQWPWLLLLLPLPLLIRKLMPASGSNRGAALQVPFYSQLQGLGEGVIERGNNWWVALLVALAWICLVVAAARPNWVGNPVPIPTIGRDIMMAVDLSQSMTTEDMVIGNRTVDRLSAIKHVASDFIDNREGDRLGLVLFGERAYVYVPLTMDRETVGSMLADTEIGLAGQATAIGDAIGLSVKYLRDRPSKGYVLVLLTDGENTAGALQPLQAAELAAKENIKIYSIGIGADRMARRGLFSTGYVNPSRGLDEATLTAVAEQTGGRYFRARDINSLAEIYRQIDQLELTEGEASFVRPTRSLFYWPLTAALALATLIGLLRVVPSLITRLHATGEPAVEEKPLAESGA